MYQIFSTFEDMNIDLGASEEQRFIDNILRGSGKLFLFLFKAVIR